VSFADKKMRIKVNNSASPLIHSLAVPTAVRELDVSFSLKGNLNLGKKKQGSKGADDFLLRVGLVFEGDKKLGFFQRQFAADWVKQLFNLASDKTGIDGIVFYNVYSDQALASKKRVHPASELLTEVFVAKAVKGKETTMKVKIRKKEKVLALWISCDGDDTQSQYEVVITNLQLKGL
jgi:hypothetical protein